jgi:hypothetical protein
MAISLTRGLDSFKTPLAASRHDRVRKRSDVRAHVDDDVGRIEAGGQPVLVEDDHAVEDHPIERAPAGIPSL